MKTYTFAVPCSLYLRINAESEESAVALAGAWQSHARRWDEFATVEDPGEYLETEPAGRYELLDATAYVEDTTEPVLNQTEDADEE